MIKTTKQMRQRGATSLFIVLFSTLLFTVITVGFISLMTSDQRRAIDSEWSEGAYDSALAGVEDAKRALAICRDDASSNACKAIDAKNCNTIPEAGLVSDVDGNGEVLIQSTSGGGLAGSAVNQAYTCVIVKRDNPDNKGQLDQDESVLIALKAGDKKFDRVTLSWFTREDAGGDATFTRTGSGPTSTDQLPTFGDWSNNASRPPLLRAQLMQYDRSKDITLSDFDMNSYAHTAFLYPNDGVGLPSVSLSGQDRRNPAKLGGSSSKSSPVSTNCVKSIPSLGYACEMTLVLPDMNKREALLRLTALYEKTTYKVQLKNGPSEIINFVDTQPSVDSTGRAGDVFRRVEARIDMDGNNSDAVVPYPRATIDVTENLCKSLKLGGKNPLPGSGDCKPY